jgi:hypothetical protein
MDLTGFRIALPIMAVWKEIILTCSDNLKTCKVFASLWPDRTGFMEA